MNFADLAEHFTDEAKAHTFVEGLLWPEGPVCPHCGSVGQSYRLQPNEDTKVRVGLWKCTPCRKQFTVKVGTIFEASHIPLRKWLMAIYLMCSSKKGVSANQISRSLGISYKSAWHLCHRIRLAMTKEPLLTKLGGNRDSVVEVDETFVGGKNKNRHRNKRKNPPKKAIVMSLVERGGEARTFVIPTTRASTLQPVIVPNVNGTATIVTDQHTGYFDLDRRFREHHSVNHSRGEYVRRAGREAFVRGLVVHTNFAESYHSLLKRGIIGTYHHVSSKHLPRYLREFEFRWNSRKVTDGERTVDAIRGTKGKRLMYRKPATN
ncbi:MAG: IS1595 family transposase [Dongiaceae bacterium]